MLDNQEIVVGLDHRRESDMIIDWAVAESRATHSPLHLVSAYDWIPPYWWGRIGGVSAEEQSMLRPVAEAAVRDAVDRVRELAPEIPVTAAATAGDPVDVLLHCSRRASLLVLGTRHLPAIGSALLGSVSSAVALRAQCPIVVLRGPSGNPAERAAVVAGVDGGPADADVLAFAFERASAHDVPLQAVLCAHPDLLATMQWRGTPPPPVEAEVWLSESLAGWREKYPQVEVHTAVIREHAGAGLVAGSHAAYLLVVGSRTRTRRTGGLLGSTSQNVLHHATCPVAVVPTGGGDRDAH